MANTPYRPDAAGVPSRAQRQPTNGLAVAAMVVSLIAVPFTVLGLLIYLFTWAIVPALVLSIIGVVLGAIALKRLRGNSQRGRGMALTGLIAGSICLVGGGIRDILAFANDQGQLLSQLGLSGGKGSSPY